MRNKFLTEHGQPKHPVVQHDLVNNGQKVRAKALVHQDAWAQDNCPAPSVEDPQRYLTVDLPPDEFAALPERTWGINDQGDITHIDPE